MTTHGRSKTKEYRVWIGMKKRCEDPKSEGYKDYGGRGIFIVPRWQSFENFYEDMGMCPPKMTIERLDNNGPYSPENCEWRSYQAQARNKRTNRIITVNGQSRTLAEWTDITGLTRETIRNRIDCYGWSEEEALTIPSQGHNRRFIRAFGERRHIDEWSAKSGIITDTIDYRLKHGWTPEAAVSTPPNPNRQRKALRNSLAGDSTKGP
jgi:hypothetical protein